ncbi:hypothetical protein, partial [Pseudomonas poae]|uniref:hypothetical protein n=1 Tax=Pseudomonas poae TaxID=200451 RepID=UPI0034D44AF2
PKTMFCAGSGTPRFLLFGELRAPTRASPLATGTWLPEAVGQLPIYQLRHRYREKAPSHMLFFIQPKSAFADTPLLQP